jgi:hypothetical protein
MSASEMGATMMGDTDSSEGTDTSSIETTSKPTRRRQRTNRKQREPAQLASIIPALRPLVRKAIAATAARDAENVMLELHSAYYHLAMLPLYRCTRPEEHEPRWVPVVVDGPTRDRPHIFDLALCRNPDCSSKSSTRPDLILAEAYALASRYWERLADREQRLHSQHEQLERAQGAERTKLERDRNSLQHEDFNAADEAVRS